LAHHRSVQTAPAKIAIIFGVLIGLMASPVSLEAKRKDDVLVLENGDRMTGEVKKLTRGELYFNTGYFAEDVRIDWTKVSRLVSLDRYQIILSNGQQLVGEIEPEDGTSQPPSTKSRSGRRSDFSMFRFKTTQIDANFAVYPNLSTAGRVRLSAKPISVWNWFETSTGASICTRTTTRSRLWMHLGTISV
jgi:hypothetical protein